MPVARAALVAGLSAPAALDRARAIVGAPESAWTVAAVERSIARGHVSLLAGLALPGDCQRRLEEWARAQSPHGPLGPLARGLLDRGKHGGRVLGVAPARIQYWRSLRAWCNRGSVAGVSADDLLELLDCPPETPASELWDLVELVGAWHRHRSEPLGDLPVQDPSAPEALEEYRAYCARLRRMGERFAQSAGVERWATWLMVMVRQHDDARDVLGLLADGFLGPLGELLIREAIAKGTVRDLEEFAIDVVSFHPAPTAVAELVPRLSHDACLGLLKDVFATDDMTLDAPIRTVADLVGAEIDEPSRQQVVASAAPRLTPEDILPFLVESRSVRARERAAGALQLMAGPVPSRGDQGGGPTPPPVAQPTRVFAQPVAEPGEHARPPRKR